MIVWLKIFWLTITKRIVRIPKGTYVKFVKQNAIYPVKNIYFPVSIIPDGNYFFLFNSLRGLCKFVPTKIYNEEQNNEEFYSLPVAYVVIKNKKVVYRKIFNRIRFELAQEKLDEIETTRK